jgi:hypothetical protein
MSTVGNASRSTPDPNQRKGHYVPHRLVVTGRPQDLAKFQQHLQHDAHLQSLVKHEPATTLAHPDLPTVKAFDGQSQQWVALKLGSAVSPSLNTHYQQQLAQKQVVTHRYLINGDQDVLAVTKQLYDHLQGHSDIDLHRLSVFVEPVGRFSSPGHDPGGGSPDLREYARAARDAQASDFQTQPCFTRIGMANTASGSNNGADTTIVILDTAPAPEHLDTAMVDYFIDMAGPNDEFPPITPLPEVPPQPCFDLPQTLRTRPEKPVDAIKTAQIEPYHGLMAASLVRQLAPKATIILLKVLNDRGEVAGSTLASALDFVTYLHQHEVTADGKPLVKTHLVINMSLGILRSNSEVVEACYLLEACERSCEAGALLVCASGNDSYQGRPKNPQEPAAYGYYNDTDATNSQVIAVAATSDKPTAYAFFSNRGNLAAPGYELLLDTGANWEHHQGETRYIYWSGTSFAAPQVSAAAALVLEAGTAPANVKQVLWSSATPPTRWDSIPELNLAKAVKL